VISNGAALFADRSLLSFSNIFIKTLKHRVARLWIVDKHAEALKADERSMWVPPESAIDALTRASVAIISGSALVEGGIEELLAAAAAARIRIMAGPTTPLWPRPFFKLGVNILGGIRVRHGAHLLAMVGQGGSGYFFEQAAEKVCVMRPAAAERTSHARTDYCPRAFRFDSFLRRERPNHAVRWQHGRSGSRHCP
jgi:Putative heavy-metal chelation